jgi:hypothetical protein
VGLSFYVPSAPTLAAHLFFDPGHHAEAALRLIACKATRSLLEVSKKQRDLRAALKLPELA